jgi:hypothetical protein
LDLSYVGVDERFCALAERSRLTNAWACALSTGVDNLISSSATVAEKCVKKEAKASSLFFFSRVDHAFNWFFVMPCNSVASWCCSSFNASTWLDVQQWAGVAGQSTDTGKGKQTAGHEMDQFSKLGVDIHGDGWVARGVAAGRGGGVVGLT